MKLRLKTYLTLTFSLVVQLALGQERALNAPKVTPQLTAASRADFEKAKASFQDKFRRDTQLLVKVNDTLRIPILGWPSRFRLYTDTLVKEGEEDLREYHYLGQFPDIGYYVVEGNFWEMSECYLITKRPGMIYTLWTLPALSPSSLFLACLSPPYGMEGNPNGLQIWKVDKERDGIFKYLELEQEAWTPLDFCWETDYSLILKVMAMKRLWEEPKEEDAYYIRLVTN